MPTYYLNHTSGDDAHDGLSELRPWKTLAKLSDFRPAPGDTIRLQGGATFPGSIRWFWAGVGDGQRPITVGSYGAGKATVVSPPDEPGFFYAGAGGIHLEGIIFRGRCHDPKIGGVVIESAGDGCQNVRLTDVEASGYGLGGAMVTNVRGLVVERGHYHHNVNGLFVSSCRDVQVRGTWGHDNDYIGPPRSDLQAGNGIGIFFSQDVLVKGAHANRNGAKTLNAGGHCGLFLSDCDRAKVHRCEAHDNGDPTHDDGQGICLYGCWDSEIADYCLATGNLNAGLCLFQDEWCRHVRRCEIRDSVATGNLCDLSLVGTVLDSAIHGNRVYSTRHKAFDVAGHSDGPSERRVTVYGNDFRAAPGNYLLVAVPGLRGVTGLTGNGWDAPEAEPFLVRGRGYGKVHDALAAEPVGTL